MTTYTFDDVAVVMGTYNEEEAIEHVLTDIDEVTDGRAEVVCVDGSSDRTPEVARDHGARVIEQEPQGYGVAVREAVLAPDRPVVVTTDCDDTYPMDRLPDFLDAINEGYDVVSGDRLSKGAETMPRFNRLGNQAFALGASVLAGRRLRDTTTGMRAYRKDVIDEVTWTENTGLSADRVQRTSR
jgi:glycosyltransferase involved in cell wall biosynthesis